MSFPWPLITPILEVWATVSDPITQSSHKLSRLSTIYHFWYHYGYTTTISSFSF